MPKKADKTSKKRQTPKRSYQTQIVEVIISLLAIFSWNNQHSWQKGPTPPYFKKTPLLHYLSPLMLSNHPFFMSPPMLIPTALATVLFLWLNGWLHHIRCVILLNDIMDLHMLSLHVCFIKQGVKLNEVWHIMWCFAGTLIW